MGLPTAVTQMALIATLRNDEQLQNLLGRSQPPYGIYDGGGVPTNRAFPYVVVFPITTMRGTTRAMGRDAADVYMQTAVFTQSYGLDQARAIAERIYALTQDTTFVLQQGYSHVLTLFENEQELLEDDGLTQQIAHRYLFMVQDGGQH